MYLSDVTIKKCLASGTIEIVPKVKEEDIRPVGIRLHLDAKVLVPEPGVVDPANPTELAHRTVDLGAEAFLLKPGDFILASTIEKIKTASDLLGFLDGRSTIARLGMTVHVSSFVVDGNHDNARTITLEIKNLGVHSIRLRKGDAVAQICFAQLTEPIQQQSQSQYHGQDGVVAPNVVFRPGVDV